MKGLKWHVKSTSPGANAQGPEVCTSPGTWLHSLTPCTLDSAPEPHGLTGIPGRNCTVLTSPLLLDTALELAIRAVGLGFLISHSDAAVLMALFLMCETQENSAFMAFVDNGDLGDVSLAIFRCTWFQDFERK